MADSDRSRSRAPSSVAEAGDQIRTQRFTGRTTTGINNKAKMIAALRREQAKILAEGKVLEGALPPINDQMSPSDILNAQRSINRALGRPSDHDFTGSQGNNSDSRTARRAAGGGVITSNDTPGAAKVPEKVEIASVEDAWNNNPEEAVTPEERGEAPAQVAGAPGNPLLDQMVRDGTLPQGANLERTGAGLQTRVMSESGERNVMIQPTGSQALEGKFGAVAQQQFGKPWGQLDPGQRKMILRANPVARTRGEVLANGQGKFNTRGERFMNVAGSEHTPGGGTIREVDPSQAHDLTRIKAGDSLLPRNALAGLLAPEQYADASGNRVAYVTRGAPDTVEPKPAAPAPQGTPAPGESKPPIQIPGIDPAQLAQARADKFSPVAPLDFTGPKINFDAPAAAPNNPLASLTPEPEAPKPRTNTFQPPAPSRPVVKYGPAPTLGNHNTAPKPGTPIRTSGVWDAFKKGNLSEVAAHINNADSSATAAITDKARDLTKGSAFAQTPMGQRFVSGDPAPAPVAPATPAAPQITPPAQPAPSPVVNAQPPTPAAQPPPKTPPPMEDPKKKRNPLDKIASF